MNVNVVVTQPIAEGSLVLIDDAMDFGDDDMMGEVVKQIGERAGHNRFLVVHGNIASGENLKVIGCEEWLPGLAAALRPLIAGLVRDELARLEAPDGLG